jgi:RNA-directed DNA polymerase
MNDPVNAKSPSKGRGFGWKKYPNATLYARGMIYIGSGVIRYE